MAVTMSIIQTLVSEHGEEYRRLIVDALLFLDAQESSWGLDTPIDREKFIADLIQNERNRKQ